jgi:hypothetical protein
MATQCRSVLRSCLAQFVRLDGCGAPVTGATSKLTTKGYISIAATAQIETGDEVIVKNACGELCVNEKDCDKFKRYDLEMQFCSVDPDLIELLTPGRAIIDGTDTIGFAHGESDECDSFSVELWNAVAAQECAVGADPEWFYVAFPWVNNGVVGDITFDGAALTVTVTASTKGTGAAWGVGPSDVLPVASPALPGDHIIGVITTVQPPEAVCGLQPL